jgi:flagellar biosynthesis/type III secretory pathway chaperone
MIKIDGGWEELFELLRREIEGYGQLFAVLESQRSCLKMQDLEGILDCNSGLESQAHRLAELRQERIGRVEQLYHHCDLPVGQSRMTVRSLIRYAPPQFKALFESLIGEVERLLVSSKQYLKRNQMLLRRAHDFNQNFLSLVAPSQTATPSYQRNGARGFSTGIAHASGYLKRA